jgi:hypothetical protein
MIAGLLGGGIARKLLKTALPVVVIAGAGWWLVGLIQENRDLEHTVAAYEASLEAKNKALAAERRKVAVLSAAKAEAERRAASFRELREEVADAPEADDGPVAPVLARTLERLRERATGEDRAGDAGDPGGDPEEPGDP